ncbi:MAG: uracil-DNA glycosylase [Planctomycetes bacterium]|nr:uracil-DNA glycosylase [Planctomycetota bacterium]
MAPAAEDPAHADPMAERAALARALARELGRRRWHGERQLARAAAPAQPTEAQGTQPAEAQGTQPAEAHGAQATARTTAPPSPPPQPARPEAATAPRVESLPAPGRRIPMPPAPQGPLSPDEVAARREAVRGLAAAATSLEELREQVSACTACGLCAARTQTVFMDGDGRRGIAFVGEAPGEQEDRQGVPFVGPAGQLLTDIITKGMGIRREEVAIAHVVKCRPPGSREALPEELAICTPWLERQLELVGARVLIPLGRRAAGHMLGTPEAALGSMRGQTHPRGEVTVVPTLHPADLLSNPGDKRLCWADIQQAMAAAGLPRSTR